MIVIAYRDVKFSYRIVSYRIVAVTIATQHDFTLHEGQGHIVFIPVSLNHDGTDGPRIQSSRLLVIRLRLRPVRPSVYTAALISDLLLTYPPKPCFALGSRLDRQWFPWLTNHYIGDDLCFAV